MITLHETPSGTQVCINRKHVAYIQDMGEEGTKVVMSSNSYIDVEEEFEAVSIWMKRWSE